MGYVLAPIVSDCGISPTGSRCRFFPVALLGLANVGSPRNRNVAVSLMIPFVYLFDGGIVPAGMGVVGEYHGFALGFLLMGGLLLVNLCLLLFLRARPDPNR